MRGEIGLGEYLEKGTVSTRTWPRDEAPEACGHWASVAVAGRGPASVRSSDSRYIFYWYLCDCVSECVFTFLNSVSKHISPALFRAGTYIFDVRAAAQATFSNRAF